MKGDTNQDTFTLHNMLVNCVLKNKGHKSKNDIIVGEHRFKFWCIVNLFISHTMLIIMVCKCISNNCKIFFSLNQKIKNVIKCIT